MTSKLNPNEERHTPGEHLIHALQQLDKISLEKTLPKEVRDKAWSGCHALTYFLAWLRQHHQATHADAFSGTATVTIRKPEDRNPRSDLRPQNPEDLAKPKEPEALTQNELWGS